MKLYPDYVFRNGGTTSLWIAPEFDTAPARDLLADPDRLFSLPQCEIVKDQRKIKVARVRLEIAGQVRRIYLKRYNAFSLRYSAGSLWVPSGAERAWAGAALLFGGGFRTGRPIAAVEQRRWRMLSRSFYLSEEIPGAKTADAYWREDLVLAKGAQGVHRRRKFLKDLAELFRSLHRANIYHNDLKDANILAAPEGRAGGESFYLLDLEGIRGYRRLNVRRRVKNLVQLNRTMGRLLRRTARLYWLKVYLGEAFSVRRERREWVRRVIKESDRRDRLSSQKR